MRSDQDAKSEATPLLRQWQLLKILSVRRMGMTVREMSEDTGVSQKTIRRDLQLFQQLGFPVEETTTDRGRKHWRIAPNWGEPQTNFTFDEAIALHIAQRHLDCLAGTPFWRAARRAFQKIRSSFSDSVVAYLSRMAGRLHQVSTGAGDYAHKEELIDQLMIGIEDNHAVFITYRSQRATEPVTYDIYPYGITNYFGSLYLIGYHTDAREIRTWKIDRIEDAEATQIPFQRPREFDLASFLGGSFGVYHGRDRVTVRIRFSPTVARYVQESRWHSSQRFASQKGGGLVAEFDLSATEEIKSWILSFGQHAVVLEPESLRSEVRQELASLLAEYETTDQTLGHGRVRKSSVRNKNDSS